MYLRIGDFGLPEMQLLVSLSVLVVVSADVLPPCHRLNNLIQDIYVPNLNSCNTCVCKNRHQYLICKAFNEQDAALIRGDCPLSPINGNPEGIMRWEGGTNCATYKQNCGT